VPYDLNPTQGDLAAARATVERVFDACERQLPTERSVAVALGWSDDEVVATDFGGAMGVCLAPDRVELVFTSGESDWTTALAAAAARQYGRAWVRGEFPDGARVFWWQDLLEAAAGERLVARVADPSVAPWATLDDGAIEEWWPTIREALDDPVEDPLVDPAASDVPPFLAEGVAAVLADALEVEVQAFPSATRSTVADALGDVFE